MAKLVHRIFRVVATACLLAFLFVCRPSYAQKLHIGEAAPPAMLTTLDGQHISSQDLLGHTVILTFWATWCEPCQEELPLLSHYETAHRDQGLVVLGFSLDDKETLNKVHEVAKQLSFPVGLLSQSQAQGYGRMWRIPVSFVIDAAGMLQYNGWQSDEPAWSETRLEKEVGPLLTSGRYSNDNHIP